MAPHGRARCAGIGGCGRWRCARCSGGRPPSLPRSVSAALRGGPSRPSCSCSPSRSRRRTGSSANMASGFSSEPWSCRLRAAALPLPAAIAHHALAAMLLIGLAVLLVTSRAYAIMQALCEPSASSSLWTRTDTRIALLLLHSLWLIGAYAAIIRSVDPERRYRRGAAPRPPAPCRPRCCWPSRTIRPSSRKAGTTVRPTAGPMCAA